MKEEDETAETGAPLARPLQDAIDKFKLWNLEQVESQQRQEQIDTTLYHYTDSFGLRGIIESGRIWFTDYRHLNDPSELIHGIKLAHTVAREISDGADGRVRLFLETCIDMFRQENFNLTLAFYIASFSRERDDIGQWRAYADNGRGFAIGFSSSMFKISEEPLENKLSEFVGPVLYNIDEVRARHRLALEQAAEIFFDAVNANAVLMQNKTIGLPFIQEFAREVIASPLIWNCLTSKHLAYEHEREVRLIILEQAQRVSPYVMTRVRGGEVVPYIAHEMPLREPHKITEIVIGPAAPTDAERRVRAMLRELGMNQKIPIVRSDIPYRSL